MRLALCLLVASLLSACGNRGEQDPAGQERASREKARAAIEEREAKQLEADRQAGEGSAACSKLANDTRACEALKRAQREGAAVCAAMDVDLFQKCARYKASMGER
jgi:hypothetical protein